MKKQTAATQEDPTHKYKRPQKIKDYHRQQEFMDTPEHFVIIEATTKAGKTTGCLVWLFEKALKGCAGKNYWWVAPVREQAKMAFERLELYIRDRALYKTNRTRLTITLFNGATIFFKSADRPDIMYGDDVTAVVIDEASRMKEEAWFAIRTTLTKTRGYAKIIGNVKGTNNWAYNLARKAEAGELPDWRYFRITADDAVQAGVLEQGAIDEAKATLPTGVFLELYYGIPNQNSNNKFCYAFDRTKHIGKAPEFRKNCPVYLSFDFNHNPICCTAFQFFQNTLYAIKCFKLENSNIYNLCKEIKNTYPKVEFIVTGDASGYSNSALVEDQLTYYSIIEKQLGLYDHQMKIPSVNPPIYKNQVRVNAVLQHCKVQIDPDHAADLIFDLMYVEVNPDGSIKKGNRKNPARQADLLDTFRYMLNNIMTEYWKISKFD